MKNEQDMKRTLPTMLLVFSVISICGCSGPAISSFPEASNDVNSNFALGRQLRDRCQYTFDLKDCLEWREYKAAQELANPSTNYEEDLARWEQEGPY